MQRVLGFELLTLARWLTTRPIQTRMADACRLIAEVEAADRGFRRGRGADADLGDGSLMARLARLRPPREGYADVPDFLIALQIAARALLQHTAAKPEGHPLRHDLPGARTCRDRGRTGADDGGDQAAGDIGRSGLDADP